MRSAKISRKTAETDIKLSLNIDGEGKANINSGIGFLDHMLTLFARHSGIDLDAECKGDIKVDYHHSAEDMGICLGAALAEAAGEKIGIKRYGSAVIPMDESLILSAVDFSGRCHLSFDVPCPTEKVGDFDTELVEEFFRAFVRKSEITLHIKKLDGTNTHHIIEGVFKSVARSIRQALEKDERFGNSVPSTKGVL